MESREVACIDTVYGVGEVADSERRPQDSDNTACGARGEKAKYKSCFPFSANVISKKHGEQEKKPTTTSATASRWRCAKPNCAAGGVPRVFVVAAVGGWSVGKGEMEAGCR